MVVTAIGATAAAVDVAAFDLSLCLLHARLHGIYTYLPSMIIHTYVYIHHYISIMSMQETRGTHGLGGNRGA